MYTWSRNEEEGYSHPCVSVEECIDNARNDESEDACIGETDPRSFTIYVGEVVHPDIAQLAGAWAADYLIPGVTGFNEEEFGEWWEASIYRLEKAAQYTLAPFIENAVREWLATQPTITAFNVGEITEHRVTLTEAQP